MSQLASPDRAVMTPSIYCSEQDKLFDRACRYMLMHLSEKVLLDRVCQEVGSNRNKLSTLFRNRCGCGVMHWLRDQRLKRSAELLCGTDKSICFIAVESGFCDSANFCHAFKNKFTVAPREYRRLFSLHVSN